MKKRTIVVLLFVFQVTAAFSQTISKEELSFLTSEWKGERFPDGRPKISVCYIYITFCKHFYGPGIGVAGSSLFLPPVFDVFFNIGTAWHEHRC